MGNFFGCIIFFAHALRYKGLYLFVRMLFTQQLDRGGGQSVGIWLRADLDNMICDFIDQLRTATEQGWDQSKPEHYRAILAALESALKERRGLSAAPGGAYEDHPEPCQVAPVRPEAMMPVALRWSLLSLLAIVPSRAQ
jgi:hypothetical protein